MSELRGCVQDFGLLSLVRFLADSGRSGSLQISQAGLVGELTFDHGRVISVATGEEREQSALELLALAFTGGNFVYTDSQAAAPTLDLQLNSGDLRGEIEHLLGRADDDRGLPLLMSVPHIVDWSGELDRQIELNRSELGLLIDVDGQHTTAEVVRDRGILWGLRVLTRLNEAGVIRFEAPPESRAEQAEPEAEIVEPQASAPAPAMPKVSPRRRTRWLRAVLQFAALTALFAVGLRSIVQTVHVQGESMLPGLQDGELVLVNRAAYFHLEGSGIAEFLPGTPQGAMRYLLGGPQRGDVVVFQSPTAPGTEFVKRIIALPGEDVRIEGGKVLIDDLLLDEPYTAPADAGVDRYPEDGQPIHVPDDSYFVLGDNRSVSLDSRGGWLVQVDKLVGRAWLVYWPPSAWGVIPPGVATGLARLAAGGDRQSAPVVELSASRTGPAPEATATPLLPTLVQATVVPTPVTPVTLLTGLIKDQPAWPNDPNGNARLDGDSYRLSTSSFSHFVAVDAPVEGTFADVEVVATFRKLGGPRGGGYGIIVRDQEPGPRNSLDQDGQFYLAEVGDQGEVSMWRRGDGRWVELFPWTPSEAVHLGGANNELWVRAAGSKLTFLVNGTEVATVWDAVLSRGRIGVFVGGDLNDVELDRFTAQIPQTEVAP